MDSLFWCFIFRNLWKHCMYFVVVVSNPCWMGRDYRVEKKTNVQKKKLWANANASFLLVCLSHEILELHKTNQVTSKYKLIVLFRFVFDRGYLLHMCFFFMICLKPNEKSKKRLNCWFPGNEISKSKKVEISIEKWVIVKLYVIFLLCNLIFA